MTGRYYNATSPKQASSEAGEMSELQQDYLMGKVSGAQGAGMEDAAQNLQIKCE